MKNQLNILGKIVESKLDRVHIEIDKDNEYLLFNKHYSINISEFKELIFFFEAEKIIISICYKFNFNMNKVCDISSHVYLDNRIFLMRDILEKINFKIPSLKENELKRIGKIINNANYSKSSKKLDDLCIALIKNAKKLNIDVIDLIYKKIQEQNIKDILDDDVKE